MFPFLTFEPIFFFESVNFVVSNSSQIGEWALSFDSYSDVASSIDVQRQKVLRVFTYGSPPIFEILSTSDVKESEPEGFSCSILDAFDLPTDIVYSYNQPWDPVIRLFSQYDPLYPLIDDLGEFLLRVQ
jgi:hypothetical protein